MSLASYRAAPPRGKLNRWDLLGQEPFSFAPTICVKRYCTNRPANVEGLLAR